MRGALSARRVDIVYADRGGMFAHTRLRVQAVRELRGSDLHLHRIADETHLVGGDAALGRIHSDAAAPDVEV